MSLSTTVRPQEVPAAVAARRRYLPLDTLRTIAFGAVFLEHVFGWPLVWSGVDLFFVLSGYLITGILLRSLGERHYFRDFYLRRTLRIFPAYYLLGLALATVLLVQWFSPTPWCALFAGNVYFAIHGLTSPIAPLWSLAVEEQFYLLWPLALLLTRHRYRRHLLVATLVLAPLFRAMFVAVHLPLGAYTLLPCRMDELGAGAVLAHIEYHGGLAALQRLRRWALALVIPAFLLFAGSAHYGGANGHGGYVYSVVTYEGTWLFYAPILLIVLTLRSPRTIALMSIPQIVFVGQISYGLYLIHRPIILWFHDHGLRGWTNAGASCVASIAIAAISWRYMERPMIVLGRVLTNSGRTRTAPL